MERSKPILERRLSIRCGIVGNRPRFATLIGKRQYKNTTIDGADDDDDGWYGMVFFLLEIEKKGGGGAVGTMGNQGGVAIDVMSW